MTMHENHRLPARLKERLPLFLAGLLILVCLSVLATPLIAPHCLFLPTGNPGAHEALLTRNDVEHLTCVTEDGTLSGYFVRGSDGPAPLILYLNGNHENAADFITALLADDARLAALAGCHFAQFDYPAYGFSEGRPSDASLKRTALAAYDLLSARDDVTEVIVLGYSIGTGPANYLAANREVSGLILFAPYADGYDLFNNILSVFHGPLRSLVNYDMSSVTCAAGIRVSPLVFATPGDHLVPYSSTLRLCAAYPLGCELITVPDIHHRDFWTTPEVLQRVEAFIREVTGRE